MKEMELGPNGGLIFCMELLLENKGNVINNKKVLSRWKPNRLVLPLPRFLPNFGSAKSLRSVFLIRGEFLP